MNHYKLKIILKSSLGTKLMADTIWEIYVMVFYLMKERIN